MSPFPSPRACRRPARVARLVLAAAAAALLPGCAPAAATIAVGETVFSPSLDLLEDRVTVRMPDGVYLVEALGVVDEAFVDGETVRAPDGAVLVEVDWSDGGYPGDWAPGRTEAALRAGGTVVPLELDPSGPGTPVVVLPGDGGDAELVLSFEGREAVVSVATAELVETSPFVEMAPWSGVVDAPVQSPAGWHAMVPPALQADLRMVGYLPGRGWAPEGEVWVEGRLVPRPGTLLPVGEDNHDGVPVACAVEGAGVLADGSEHPLELTLEEGSGIAGGDAVRLLGTVPAETAEIRLRVSYALTAEGEVEVRQDGSTTGDVFEPERL